MSLILTLATLGYIAICVGLGFLRGLQRQRIRTIMIAACAVVAIIFLACLRGSILTDSAFNDSFLPVVEESVNDLSSIAPNGSATLSILAGLSSSLISAVFFFIVFFVLSVLTLIAYLIIALCAGKKMKEADEYASKKTLRFCLLAVAQAIVVIAVCAVPVVFYTDLASDTLDTVQESGIVESQETKDLLNTLSDDVVGPIHDNPVVVVCRAMGGKAISNGLAKVTYTANGETVKTNLNDELKSVVRIAGKAVKLKDLSFEKLSNDDVNALKDVAESFTDSKILTTVVCEVLKIATDKWDNGEKILDVAKPNLGSGDVGEMMDSLLDILGTDSKSADLLKKDLFTVADFMKLIVDYDAVSAFSTGEISDLSSVVGKTVNGKDILTAMNDVLNQNTSFKPVQDQLNAIVDDVKAQAMEEMFGISAEQAELLTEKTDEIFEDVAVTINEIDKTKPIEEQKTELSSSIETIIKENATEVDVNIEDLDISAVSDSVAQEFLENPEKYANVSKEDIQAYLLQYASEQMAQ